VDESAPLPPYSEFHFDQQDLPGLVAEKESAPANDYIGSSAYQANPRGSPILDSKCDLPPLPPKPKELLCEGDFPSQSGEVSPFSDPISELPPILRPGFIDDGRNLSTHAMYGSDEDAYDGI
jgi:hypothetical protein